MFQTHILMFCGSWEIGAAGVGVVRSLRWQIRQLQLLGRIISERVFFFQNIILFHSFIAVCKGGLLGIQFVYYCVYCNSQCFGNILRCVIYITRLKLYAIKNVNVFLQRRQRLKMKGPYRSVGHAQTQKVIWNVLGRAEFKLAGHV